jgi:predicted dehydrogenase
MDCLMSDFTVQQKAELPRNPLPIVSIGVGGIVHDAHYPAYKIAGFEVVGAYDHNPQQAEMMQEKFIIPHLYGSLQEVVAQSPDHAVFDVAVPGFAILDVLPYFPDGRAVLLQKPMGENIEDARKILKLCREKNLKAAINFQLRFAPYVIAARSMIEQGLIGEVWDVEARIQTYTPWSLWPYLKGLPRLEILYHSIHYVDLLRSFLGTPEKIYAKSLKHPLNPHLASTCSTMILDYGERARANIMTNHGHSYGEEKEQSYIKWEGSKGAIQAQMGVNLNYPVGKADTFEYVIVEEGTKPTWKTLDIDGSWFPHAFIGTMSSLMRYMNGETNVLPTSVEDAFMTMATVEAAYESSESGGTIIPNV